MLFSKTFLLVSILFFTMSNRAKPICKLPETKTEVVGMGLLVTGITSLVFTMRQGFWDLCGHVHGQTEADIHMKTEENLKKMYIRLIVGSSFTLTGLLLTECRIANKFR